MNGIAFNESSGTIASNNVANSPDGALLGDTVFTPGKFGNGVFLDGAGDRVRIGSFFPDGLSAYTYSAWFKSDVTSGTRFRKGAKSFLNGHLGSNEKTFVTTLAGG